MNTTRNRAAILAQFLRDAVKDLRATEGRTDDNAVLVRGAALESIDGCAEELELVATMPRRPASLPAPGATIRRLETDGRMSTSNASHPVSQADGAAAADDRVPAPSSHELYYAHRAAQLADGVPDPAGVR